jgi:hypothetical protein
MATCKNITIKKRNCFSDIDHEAPSVKKQFCCPFSSCNAKSDFTSMLEHLNVSHAILSSFRLLSCFECEFIFENNISRAYHTLEHMLHIVEDEKCDLLPYPEIYIGYSKVVTADDATFGFFFGLKHIIKNHMETLGRHLCQHQKHDWSTSAKKKWVTYHDYYGYLDAFLEHREFKEQVKCNQNHPKCRGKYFDFLDGMMHLATFHNYKVLKNVACMWCMQIFDNKLRALDHFIWCGLTHKHKYNKLQCDEAQNDLNDVVTDCLRLPNTSDFCKSVRGKIESKKTTAV